MIFRSLIFVAAVLVSSLWCAEVEGEEAGDDLTRARELSEQGTAAFERRAWNEALSAFQRSYQLNPDPSIRYEMGFCHYRLDQEDLAYRQLSAYLDEMDPSRIDAERRRQVEWWLRSARGRLGLLQIEVAQPEARVSVDGDEVGTTPLSGPVAVEPGSHRVTVALQGYEPSTLVVSVLRGQSQQIRVELVALASPGQETSEPEPVPEEPDPSIEAVDTPDAEPLTEPADSPDDTEEFFDPEPEPAPEDAPEPPRAEESGGPPYSPVWVGLTLGLACALTVAGATTGILVNLHEIDFDDAADQCQAGDSSACDRGRDIAGEGENLAAATTVLLVTAGLSAVAALVLSQFTDWGNDDQLGLTGISVGLAPSGGGGAAFSMGASLRF